MISAKELRRCGRQTMKPTDRLRAWKAEAAKDRVLGCMLMLFHHGFLSEHERSKVEKRIARWMAT